MFARGLMNLLSDFRLILLNWSSVERVTAGSGYWCAV